MLMKGLQKAGRELDLLVAEKVMELRRAVVIYAYWVPRPCWIPYDPDVYRKFVSGDPDSLPNGFEVAPNVWDEYPPAYSSDIALAWKEVVAKLRSRGLVVTVSSPPRDNKNWDVRGWNPDTNGSRFIAHAEDVEVAICLAALDAVGHPIDRSF